MVGIHTEVVKDMCVGRPITVQNPNGTGTFKIIPESYEQLASYAKCLIQDLETKEMFHSHGHIVINGFTIITKWKSYYNNIRDNYQSSRDLIIDII